MGNECLHVKPGERFGLLVVIARTGRRDSKGHSILECACDCGGPRCEKSSTALRSGRVRSCGCLTRVVDTAMLVTIELSAESNAALARRLGISRRTIRRVRAAALERRIAS